MSTGKRLAKRSIIGTRVCAPGDDGKFYSGVISGVNTPPSGNNDSSNGALTITPQTRYQVRFDPTPVGSRVPSDKKEYLDRDLIGPGFTSVTTAKLVAGQKVFLTYNGREVQGSVVEHREHLDEVEVMLTFGKQDGEKSSNTVQTVTKRIDELRLMESRKSARLADSDTDFARLADVGSDRKRSASQANIDRPDNSNSPYHINNRTSPPNNNNNPTAINNNYKPRRRTHSEQSMRSDNSDNHVIAETTTTTATNSMRTYKGNSGGSGNDSNGSSGTAYYADYSSSQMVVPEPDDSAIAAAAALICLSSPGKTTKCDDYNRYPATYMMAGGMEESSSSGNSNASGSESDNSWRSDTSSPRFPEEHWAMNHQPNSAPNSPKDEGIVPDILVYQHQYNKKRRFVMRAAAAAAAAAVADDDEEYVTMKPQHQPSKFVQTTKAKRGRPPTYRRRSPTPKQIHRHHEDAATDGDGEDSMDMSNSYGRISNGYSDIGKKYICTWSGGNGERVCGVTGNFECVSNHFAQRHNDKDEDMDFYVLEESEYNGVPRKSYESKPTACGLPTQSHWDMVKPISADPAYQMPIHRQMAAVAANAHHSVAGAEMMINREIIYVDGGSLSPRDDILARQNMSPPRPVNKPIKARASQPHRQYIINNPGPNNQNMPKVNMVHIHLNKMPAVARRGRSDVKKCRKVYGMGAKDQWCTQCKWKKACQRFNKADPGSPENNIVEYPMPEPRNHPR